MQTVRLWFAIRRWLPHLFLPGSVPIAFLTPLFSYPAGHGTGSAWLVGNETLGMHSLDLPGHALDGKIPIPRMLVAQFDSIRHERIYRELAPKVLKQFEAFLISGDMDSWFTVYLATFLLLHQVACTSYDRRRHVMENNAGEPLVSGFIIPLVVLDCSSTRNAT